MRSDQSHAQIFSGTVLPGGFAPTAQINALATTAYFISSQSDSDPSLPSLRRVIVDDGGGLPTVVSEEVIAGVEDMQVQYGVDLTGDGSANSYVNADGVVDPESVVALRLWLRLRTATAEVGFTDDMNWEYADRRYSSAATASTDDDAFRRTVVSKTIELRNRRTALVEAT
jgi:type IV pilus assembly protein PilW